ncbi:glycerate kinase [Modestobacter altitudinis]|uniref:glycerate kinase n=1 Tax=Modestobacter altitudinis TaxID=2213158 RepID=UPI001C554887|nr:glycerate kinase [Modestobacter altitudinis]
MRVLVAPDKFKGSLTALEVAEAIGRGLAAAGVAVRLFPLADGGDGSVDAAVCAGSTAHPVRVHGADGELRDAAFAFDGTTAVVEVATTCGLATLPAGELVPMSASSHGFGEAVAAAVTAGARRIVLCLGGSASTDGGAGMLTALGVRFRDAHGGEVDPAGETLIKIADLDVSGLLPLGGVELVVATDVSNPLVGPDGAAAVFGPQKGATPAQVDLLEVGLSHLAQLLGNNPQPGASPADTPGVEEPGVGAAGGLGFACRWLGAQRVPGADFFLDLLDFDGAVVDCTAVVTGEGRIDGQTLAGKLPAVVASRAIPRPVYAVVGQSLLADDECQRLGLRQVVALADLDAADSSRDPELSRRLTEQAGTLIGQRLRARE